MIRNFVISLAAAGALFAMPAFAQQAQDGAQPPMGHHWDKPNPEQMAAWHKQMCDDHYAHAASHLTFIEARLDITGAQRPLFDHWRDAVLHDAQARKDSCLAHAAMPGEHKSVVERMAMIQKRLENRLASLQAEQPSLDALYQSLSPDQKALMDEHHGHGGFGRHHEGGMHDGGMHHDDAHG